MSYQTDLKHPNWQRKRLAIFERDKWKCTRCGGGEIQLHAHHTQYHKGRKPWEYLNSDIVTLCEHCHGLIHALDRFVGVVIPWVSVDEAEQPWEIYYWTGEYLRKDHRNLDDVWVCKNHAGQEVCIGASCARMHKKPSGMIGEAFSRWAIECQKSTINEMSF